MQQTHFSPVSSLPETGKSAGSIRRLGKSYNTDFLLWQENAYGRGFKERLIVIVGGGGKPSDFCTHPLRLPGEDGLWKGNRVIAGSKSLIPALEVLFDVE
jgi:hypothetical protein